MRLPHRSLSLALASLLLTACGAKPSSAPTQSPTASRTSVVAEASTTPAGPFVLWDGRDYLKMEQPEPSLAATVKEEVRRRAIEPFLKKRLEGLAGPNFDEEFSITGMAKGSFTADRTEQRAVLYHYSYTDGVVILQEGKVVAHFSGDPGDYAKYVAIGSAPDLQENGRSELLLLRNVEDTPEVFAYAFDGAGDNLSFLGAATVFDSNVRPGEEMPAQEEDTAHVLVGSRPNFALQKDTYKKVGQGGWSQQAQADKVALNKSVEATLVRIDLAEAAQAAPLTPAVGLPVFSTGEDYKSKVRIAMFEAGWDPARSLEGDENCAAGGAFCQEYPELEAGPAAGESKAIFRWKRDDSVVKIFTVGEPPRFERLESARPENG